MKSTGKYDDLDLAIIVALKKGNQPLQDPDCQQICLKLFPGDDIFRGIDRRQQELKRQKKIKWDSKGKWKLREQGE